MASGKIRGITVEIGGDTTKLGQAIADSEKKSRSLSGELKDVNRLLKFDPSNVELVSQKQKILTEAIEESRKKLDTLREAEEQIAKQFKSGEIGEEQFRAFNREIVDTESKINRLESELKGMNDELDDVDDEAEKASNGFTIMKGAIADLIADGISMLASSVKDCMTEIVFETESAYDSFQAKTGVATESMEEFRDVINELYENNYGESFDDIAGAMAEIKQQTGEVDPTKLKELTQNALVLRDTFDFDVKESMRAVNMLMTQFGISGEEAFNLIVQGAQNGLDKNGDLLDTINEYGVHYKQLGYTAEEFFNSLVNGSETGTFSVDKLGDTMKEFGIRSKDTAKSTTEAFEALGYSTSASADDIEKVGDQIEKLEKNLNYAKMEQEGFNSKTSELTKQKNADKIAEYSEELENAKKQLEEMTASTDGSSDSVANLQKRFAEGGDTAREATAEVLEKLMNMEDEVKKNEIGVALFGTMWEDLGIEGVNALMNVNGTMDTTKASMKEITEIKYDNVGSKFETLGRKVKTDLIAPLAQKLLPTLEKIVNYAIDNSDKIVGTIKTIATVLGTIWAINKISTFITSVKTLVTTFTTLKTAITTANTAQQALNATQAMTPWGAIALGIGAVVGGIAMYNSATDDAVESTEEITTAVDEFNKKLSEQATAYNEAKEARDEALSGINHEFGYYSQLVDELDQITDENGNVKAGYEDRAEFITTTLSSALDTEITKESLVAEGKQAVIDKIDALIEKQKNQLILQQYEEAYSDAIKGSVDALAEYTSAREKYNETYDKAVEAREKLNALEEKGLDTTSRDAMFESAKAISDARDKFIEAGTDFEKAQTAYNDASTVYLGYQNTIANYEGASSAIISGDSQKISEAMLYLTHDMKTATNATKEQLEQQVTDAKVYASNLRSAYDKGLPGVTQAMITDADLYVTEAKHQLESYNVFTSDVLTASEVSLNASLSQGEHYFGAFSDIATQKGTTVGENAGQAVADGMSNTKSVIASAGVTLANAGANSINTAGSSYMSVGEYLGSRASSGLNSKSGAMSSSGSTLASSGYTAFVPFLSRFKTIGGSLGANTVSGMVGKNGAMTTAGTTLAGSGKSGFESVETESSGKNFGQGFINGMDSKSSSIWSKAWNLGQTAWNALKESIGEASPAKKPMRSGRYFTEGFAIGIDQETDLAIEAVENLSAETLGTLDASAKETQSSIRDAVSGISGEIVKETESNAKSFDNALKKIDLLRNADVYDDAQYYAELTNLRDTYLTKHSDKWFDATDKIYKYQKKTLDDQTKLYDKQKEKIVKFFEDFESKATEKIKSVENAISSSEEKFADYGHLFETVTMDLGDEAITFERLADLDESNKQLETYADNLLKVKERGNVPTEFFEMLRGLSIDEGAKFTSALLNATDTDFNKYMESWKRKQELAQELTGELYADDLTKLSEEINTEFDNLEKDFFATGENSAEQFEAGFLDAFKTIGQNIRDNVNYALADLWVEFRTGESVGGGTIPHMARGGIVDRPTILMTGDDGTEAIVPLENNTQWLDRLADKIVNRQSNKILINNDGLGAKLDRIYDRLNRLQIVLDSGALVGETIDQIDARLADKQLLSARGV